MRGEEWGSGIQWGIGARPLVWKPQETEDTFGEICYFEPVLKCMHDCTNQFNMTLKKNQFRGRKVVGQATVFAHWAQNVGRQATARRAQ